MNEKHYIREELNQLSVNDLQEILAEVAGTIAVAALSAAGRVNRKSALIETILRNQE